MTDPLHRHLAPISEAAWAAIDAEATRTLKVLLAGRKLFNFSGPLGWQASAVNLGRVEPVGQELEPGVHARLRQVQRLLELRATFTLPREEIESVERGNPAPDLDNVIDAAQRIARAEDRLVFYGHDESGVRGALAHADHKPLRIEETDYAAYPQTVGQAIEELRQAGVAGPFAIALGPRCYTGLTTTTTPSGYPVLDHVKRLVEGPVILAPAVDGALVVSQRGDDFEIVVGRDLAIGYTAHDARHVELFLEESVTFVLRGPEAAVPLSYG